MKAAEGRDDKKTKPADARKKKSEANRNLFG
jgi:hypothetical protein